MADIRVWTSQGQWSNDVITGLDKIDLIKAAIMQEYCPNYDEDYELGGLEIDHISLSSENFDADDYENDLNAFWRKFEGEFKSETGKKLDSAVTLKVRLSTLNRLAADSHLSTAYKAIIAAACVPTPVPANYCLLLKFE